MRAEKKGSTHSMALAAPTLSPPQPASSARMFKTALVLLFPLTAGLWLSSRGLLTSNFLPHWYCLAGNKRLLWTTVIADMIIGLSYIAISVTFATLVRRAGRNLPYAGFFWAFGLFMVSCGATHFLEVVTVWKPVYWLAAATKVLTAAMSAGTALVLLIAADDIVEFAHTTREAVSRRGFEPIYLPVVARQEEEVQRASSLAGVSEEPCGGITVLVADDEAALRNTIVEILRSSGYNVLESQTAEDALEIARQNAGKIDILLTDIVMPGLRGPELARRVQNIQPDVKVVFMSGYAGGLPEADLPPNSAFLQKPFRFATLLEQLKLIRRRA